MKKSNILFLGAVGFILSFVSCSKPEEKLPLFDFGSGVYDEPFVGLLKSKPALLVKSMQYPPFSWVASDTVCLEKTLEISFNEECVRSKSEAIIQFRDSLYSSLNGIRIFCNGEIAPNGEIKISADSLVKTLSLKYMVSPLMSDTVIQGCIFIQGKELDVVNGEMLQQDNNIIANWECKQEIGWPILLWLLWLVVTIIVIGLTFFFIYVIMKAIIMIFPRKNRYSSCSRNNRDFSYGTPLDSEKGKWTGKRGDSIYIFNPNAKPKAANYGNKKNQTYAEMGKELGDSEPQVRYEKGFPIFDRDFATQNGKPLQIKFDKGIKEYIDKDEVIRKNGHNINRENLHIKTFEILGKKYNMSSDEIRVFKGDGDENLIGKLSSKWGCSDEEVWRRCNNPYKIQRVLHEREDGKTVQLVPRMYHDNVSHKGGIEKVVSEILNQK